MDSNIKKQYGRFLELLGEIDDLNRAQSILSWDKHTYMPPQGAKWRSVQMSSLSKQAHEKFTSDEMGHLLESLSRWAEHEEADSPAVRIVKTTERNWNKSRRLPLDFVKERADVCNEAYFGWLKAREENSFQTYIPFLKRLVEINIKQAEIIGYKNHILDPLIDETESGLGANEIEEIFKPLPAALAKMAKTIRESGRVLRTDFMDRNFPEALQLQASYAGMKKIGFDFSRGRVDKVVHPFCSGFSPDDVRVTTRISKDNPMSCFFSCLHEGGHGLYDLHIPDKYFRTPVYAGASNGIHESQSRLWENIIGRSKSYWQNFYPEFQSIFKEQLSDVSVDEWYRAVNRVRPTYIRTEADEVTYNMHIMLRFELEKGVMDGKMRVEDLEDIYNARIMDYFGMPAPDPKNGVIQDIHWTEYFGTSYQGYTIGNIAGVQFLEAAKRAQPSIGTDIEKGVYGSLLTWLQNNMHVHGAYYQPQELLRVVTGKPLDSTEYLAYLQKKYSQVYDVKLGGL